MNARKLCALMGALLFSLAGCEHEKFELEQRVETFKVDITQIQTSGTTSSGSGAGFSIDDPLPIPLGSVKLKVSVMAIDKDGQHDASFNRPVSFRVTPGQIQSVSTNTTVPEAADLSQLFLAPMVGGMSAGEITIEVANVFGSVVVWAQDSAPEMTYAAPTSSSDASSGDETGNANYTYQAPAQPKDWEAAAPYRTHAAGASQTIYFGSPNVIDMQRMEEYDSYTTASNCADGIGSCTINNRTSSFIANFLTINAMPPYECLVVTAITNAGFYVTDLSAHYADLEGDTSHRLQMEPYTRALSHFGHLFVYNFSYPDDLALGDCLKTITGTVQEFSGNTQVTFPSWTKNERYTTDKTLIPEPIEMVFDSERMVGKYCKLGTLEDDPCYVDERSNGYRLCMAYRDRSTQYACKGEAKEAMPCTSNGFKDNLELEFVHCAHNWRNFDSESLESALIKFTNVKPSNEFVDCDSNGNGVVGFFNYSSYDENGVNTSVYQWRCSAEEYAEDDVDCECYRDCAVGHDPADPTRKDRICTEINSYESYGQWIIELEDMLHTRINIQTGTAIPQLDPRVFDMNFSGVDYSQCRLNVTGILSQTQAARPRWIIMARDSGDVCASSAPGTCPDIIAPCAE